MIDTFFMILKKGMILTMFLLFGFATVYTPIPQNMGEVHAGGAVVEVGPNVVQNTYSAVQNTLSRIYQGWIYLKENVLDGIAWTIAKQFISNMVSDIVNWIGSGFEGNPAFVQDLGDFLLESADEAVGQYINDLGGPASFLCDPFRLDVRTAVAARYDFEREGRAAPTCTLTTIVNNFEDFIEGDFHAGGWEGWFDTISEPGSTPYGATLAAQREAFSRAAEAKTEQNTLLGFGDGFFSIPWCQPIAGGAPGAETCSITRPGRVIADTLNKSLGAGQDSLTQADEFNEIIVSLISGLANQAITGTRGLLGLDGGSGAAYTPYYRGSFADDIRSDGTINDPGTGGTTGQDTTGPGLQGGVDSALAYMQELLAAQQTTLTSAITYQNAFQNFINSPFSDDEAIVLAQVFLRDTITVQDRVQSGVAGAQPIVSQYAALDAEYNSPATTVERQNQIRSTQAALLLDFNRLNLISEAEYNVFTNNWDLFFDNYGIPVSTPNFDFNGNFDGNIIIP